MDKIYILQTWAGFWVCRTVFVQPRINSRPYPTVELAKAAAKEFAAAWEMRQRSFAVIDKR